MKECEMKHIKVLGTGCTGCKTTIEMIRLIADKQGVGIELEKVEDIAEIVATGVMSTPGVLVDGNVVHAGGIPTKDKIQSWLL
jgi:small redox-active disulfide protein 2